MTSSLVLTLPWAVLRHDNHRLVPAFNRRGLVAAPDYRKAKQTAQTILAGLWRGGPLMGDVEIHARLYFPDKRKRDAGNYRKLLTDSLTGIAYADDSQLVRETWERAGFDKANPRVEITIREAA